MARDVPTVSRVRRLTLVELGKQELVEPVSGVLQIDRQAGKLTTLHQLNETVRVLAPDPINKLLVIGRVVGVV